MGRPSKTAPGIGERINKLVPKGVNRIDFAKEIGVSSTSFGAYIRGETEPPHSFYVRISEKLDIDLNWLITGSKLHRGENLPAIQENQIALPLFSIQASAGDGASELTQEVADYMVVSEGWLTKIAPTGTQLGVLEARGDSMLPVIEDGDQMIISFDISQRDVANGGIFIVSYGGNLFVKRLEILLDGSIKIISENPSYDPQIVTRETADELMNVHAKVIWIGGKPRRNS